MGTLTMLQYTSTNYPDQLVDSINELRRNEELCDVCLQIDDFFIPAHRVILSASCPYFKNLILESRTEKVLRLFNINKNGVKNIVDFFYTSAISITEENATDLLSCAITLHLEEIEMVCCDFLLEHLSAENSFRVYDISWRNGLETLKHAAEECVYSNFELIIQTSGFTQLTVDAMLSLLDPLSDVLAMEQVYRACDQWLRNGHGDRRNAIIQMIQRLPDLQGHFKGGESLIVGADVNVKTPADHKRSTRTHMNKVASKMTLRRMHGANKPYNGQGAEGAKSNTDCAKAFHTSTYCDTNVCDERIRGNVTVKTNEDANKNVNFPTASADVYMQRNRMHNVPLEKHSPTMGQKGMNNEQRDAFCKFESEHRAMDAPVDEKINTERAVKLLFKYPESDSIAETAYTTPVLSSYRAPMYHKSKTSNKQHGPVRFEKKESVIYNYIMDADIGPSVSNADCYATTTSQPLDLANNDINDTPLRNKRSPSPEQNLVIMNSAVADQTHVRSLIHAYVVPGQEFGFACVLCDKIFNTNTDLLHHVHTHGDDSIYICQDCPEKFTDAAAFDSHRKSHTCAIPITEHEPGKACIVNLLQNQNKRFLQQMSTDLLPIKAVSSNETEYSNAYENNAGVTRRSNQNPEKPFSCGICSATFSKNIRLKRHLAIHSGEKKHQCTICNKHFSRSDHLSRHIRTIHSDTSQFTCVCSKMFKRRYEYTKHLQSHERGEFPNIIQQQFNIETSIEDTNGCKIVSDQPGLKGQYSVSDQCNS